MYQHKDIESSPIELPVGKVVCVGRNYVDHVKELNNPMPEQPVLFMKPSTALRPLTDDIAIPENQGELHNEVEVAVLIGKRLSNATEQEAGEAIWGYGIGLDLTLRDVQTYLKGKGLPWERAKAFDGSCPVSGFVKSSQVESPDELSFSLQVNDKQRQSANVNCMIWGTVDLLVDISQAFTLEPGDIVMTGTPKGVGPLYPGDVLQVRLDGLISKTTHVI